MAKFKQILQKKKVKEYISALNKSTGISDYTNPLVQDAMQLALRLTPIELAVVELNLSSDGKKQSSYTVALASEYLMFEVCYLQCVTGKPPYELAKEFGLSGKDIEDYQKQWIDVRLYPLDIGNQQ